MSDKKDARKDELSEEQLGSASGGGSPFSDKVVPPKPPTGRQKSELDDAELDKASGGAGRDSPFRGPAPPIPPPGPDIPPSKAEQV